MPRGRGSRRGRGGRGASRQTNASPQQQSVDDRADSPRGLPANEDEDQDEQLMEAMRLSLADARSQSTLAQQEEAELERAIKESLSQLPGSSAEATSGRQDQESDDEFDSMINDSSLSERLAGHSNQTPISVDSAEESDNDQCDSSFRGGKRHPLQDTSAISISSSSSSEEEEAVSSSRLLGRGKRKTKKAAVKESDTDDSDSPVASSSNGRRQGGPGAKKGRSKKTKSNDEDYQPKDGDIGVLNNDQVVSRMRTMFESSLALHETGRYMKPCQAIITPLYPHQMYALAWMCDRENKKGLGVRGGILADDMGLGKTLTIISLIFTNCHDGRPLARPQHGFQRRLPKAVMRYLPQKSLLNMGGGSVAMKAHEQILDSVGTKCKRPKTAISLHRIFGNPEQETNDCYANNGRRKDNKQKVKSSKPFAALPANKASSAIDKELAAIDDSLLSENEGDEFDSMIDSGGLSEKLGLGSNSELLLKRSEKFHYNDGLSDDEEYQNMTEQERNERMKPVSANLNVDGASLEISDEEEEDEIEPSSTTNDGGQPRKRKISSSSENEELPDLNDSLALADGATESNGGRKTPPLNIQSPFLIVPELTADQKKNLVLPPREVAIVGTRRRATLIVTPASLITHWIQQLQEHVDLRVDIRVFVHHGQNKAVVSSELEDKDIVLTTYGTLSAEYNSHTHSPLLGTKWLRVCLDEGHYVKNNRAKASKAAASLDTQRKWIISGTPIQNNLGELWSLLCFLNLEPYAGNRNVFKLQIENPIKHGHPHGLVRLQTLMVAICLRRTKSDQVNGKPLVTLPTKTVRVRELEFTKEEQAVYDAYHSQGREQIIKFMKHGTLLRNYAHVFAVMMRLRQLCCHRELLPVKWQHVNMKELIALAKEQAAKAFQNTEMTGKGNEEELAKKQAEHLRDMIRDGMSDECSICLSEFDHPVITLCGHLYCRPCITQYIETAVPPPAMCPLCRGPLTTKTLLEAARDEEKEELAGEKSDPFEDIIVEVSSTKLNAVLKELKGTDRDFPGEKTVIVSQFTSLLSIVQRLLSDEGYRFTRLDGSMTTRERSSIVADFQDTSPDSPQILLLSLRAGGVGLNLTAASRMLLLDPAWNPSTEEQCFDRIHRLGQTKNVTITKFVMKESIEKQMLALQEKKKNLISGAFRQSEEQRRDQRIQDIRTIFGI